jgi:hypothetical protein
MHLRPNDFPQLLIARHNEHIRRGGSNPPTTVIPDLVDRFPHGLGTMATIAPGLEVVQHQPQVRPHLDRDLMIGVQMLLTLAEAFP